MLYFCKMLVKLKKPCIIEHMKTKHQYTVKELEKFRKFCLRHGLKFATMQEYIGALEQFFSED